MQSAALSISDALSVPTITAGSAILALLLAGAFLLERHRLVRKLRRAGTNLMAQHVEILRSREQLSTVLGAMHSLVAEVDDAGLIIRVHPTAFSSRIFHKDSAAGKSITAFLPVAAPHKLLRLLQKARETGQSQQAEVELIKDGRRMWFFVTTTCMGDARQLLVARDMTPLREAHDTVVRQERFHAALVEHGKDVSVVVDEAATIYYLSPGVHRLLGVDCESMHGRHFGEMLLETEREPFMRELAVLLNTYGKTSSFEVWAQSASQGEVLLQVHATNLLHEPEVGGVVLNCHDITYQHRYQETLQNQAITDPLTGLANRALFQDRLAHALARLGRNEAYSFAVLAIDLDRFKRINESLGHETGDKLLQLVAQLLKKCMRRVDTLARLQGDDFIVLLDDIGDKLEAIRVAVRIRETLATPQQLDGMEISMSSCVGIVYGDSTYSTPEHLIRDAETATRWAKHNTEEGYKVFHATMHAQTITQLVLESDLRKGMERKEFSLYYQPIVDLRSGHMTGMEALLRWAHPERGFISPMEFIPVAEESGLIVPLGELVISLALKQVAMLRQVAGVNKLFVSVNLSPRQLMQRNLAETVQRNLLRAHLPASALKLEVTESLVMQNPKRATDILYDLRQLGCTLAIDDFGTGYSSLSHLCQYPFDTLKVDRSFITRLEGDDLRHHAIVQAIMRMADSLNMHVVAEGIETTSQIEALSLMGCPAGQGYFFAKPMPPDDLIAFVQSHTQDSGAIEVCAETIHCMPAIVTTS